MALIAVIALGLNQARVIGGINLSVADIFAPALVVVLALHRKLFIPRIPLLFLLAVACVSLVSGLFIAPARYSFVPSTASIAAGLVKLIALSLYLIIGYTIAAHGRVGVLLKWFTFGAMVSASLGILITIVPIPPIRSFMYYGQFRFQGLFDDPNYMALISTCALACLLVVEEFSLRAKLLGSVILISAVLLTASKTGFVALAAIGIYLLFRWLHNSRVAPSILASRWVALLGAGSVAAVLAFAFLDVVTSFVSSSFGLSRIGLLLTDPESAINDQGSSRGQTWSTAIEIILQNPILGIGFGSYIEVAQATAGHRAIAHNTYLQLAADWGLPLALTFFIAVIALAIQAPSLAPKVAQGNIMRCMVVVLLIGSISVSLNNVRLFWVIIGVMAFWAIFRNGDEKSSVTRE